jgi:hypothetical protein
VSLSLRTVAMLRGLLEAGVEFVVVGGAAAILQRAVLASMTWLGRYRGRGPVTSSQ